MSEKRRKFWQPPELRALEESCDSYKALILRVGVSDLVFLEAWCLEAFCSKYPKSGTSGSELGFRVLLFLGFRV